jgi:hypothetical protein
VLTPKADIANAAPLCVGCIANITASRISRERVRRARFFQQDATCRSISPRRKSRCNVSIDGARPVIQGGRVDAAGGRCEELEDFVDAVRTGRAGVTGRRPGALALATRRGRWKGMSTSARLTNCWIASRRGERRELPARGDPDILSVGMLATRCAYGSRVTFSKVAHWPATRR